MKIHDRRPRAARVVALLVLALFTLNGAARADFNLVSLNCLHLGWGKEPYQTKKNEILKKFFTVSGADVIVLQEVMRQADVRLVNPGDYEITPTIVQGASSYKEAYAFLVSRKTFGITAPPGAFSSTINGISRPPAGIKLQPLNSKACIWVLNYHAIFGRVSDRLAEVKKIPAVYKYFANTCEQVVIAGDWNLTADTVEKIFNDSMSEFNVGPKGETSLNPKGVLSESYDHCVAEKGIVTSSTVLFPFIVQMSNGEWRAKISDHLGIQCTIRTK